MIRRPFVANRRGRYDDMPDGYGSHKDSGAAAGDELTASERDHVLQTRRRAGSADSRMNNGEPPTSIIQFVNRVVAGFAFAIMHVARLGALTHEVPDDLLEEAQHTMLGDIDGFDDTAWFDDRDACAVVFQQRNVGCGRNRGQSCCPRNSRDFRFFCLPLQNGFFSNCLSLSNATGLVA